MTAKAPGKVRRRQVDDPPPDLAAFIIARAMSEMFQSDRSRPMPEPLAAILRQMERCADASGQEEG
jgi:hypothetical protein